MKISRTINGKAVEIELTQQEMADAFEEQQNNYDMDNVRYFVDEYFDGDDGFLDDFGITAEQAVNGADKIARRFRDMEDDDCAEHWNETMRWAITYYADEIKKEQEARA